MCSGENAITRCFGIYHIIGSISNKMPITSLRGFDLLGFFITQWSLSCGQGMNSKGLEHLNMLPRQNLPIVTPSSNLFNSSSFRMANCRCRGMTRFFSLSRAALPADENNNRSENKNKCHNDK